jgi:4'-phosphopantetheinyl transferase
MAEPPDADPPLRLAADEVHVWLARTDELQAPDILARCRALLSPDEQARLARFVVAQPGLEFLVARAFLRLVLARYTAAAPHALLLGTGVHGKPHLPHHGRVRFNLSHTTGLIACAIARDREVGIDAEQASRAVDELALAERFFAPVEAADVRATPPAGRRARFFEYWTLKESYVKALGAGLSLPLESFSFHPDEPIALQVDDPRAPGSGPWQFFRLRPGGDHLVAVAVAPRQDGERGAPARLLVHDGAPLFAL